MDAFDAVHPTDQALQSYGSGRLDDILSQAVRKHLEDCPSCRRRVADLSSDSFLRRLPDAQEQPELSATGELELGDSSRERESATLAEARPSSNTLPAELVNNPDYQFVRELGRGGMGVVYLVLNRLMGRHEAIKVINRRLVERPSALERFLREIRSVAKLRHPNVVAAYSATRLGENIVYAMEYVKGLDLANLVRNEGPLSITDACRFAHQVALALQHAHEHGIVHRDIKPGNLILSRAGERSVVKILDFGLNKATADDGTDHSLTEQGQMLGTPEYVAPEQTLNAQSVDIRADIYSLGCTLYYLLSGGPPFQGASVYEVLHAHQTAVAAPLDLVRSEVPSELAAIVAKMMAKQPEHRFQTSAEVARALTPFFENGNVASDQPKPEIPLAGQVGPSLEPGEAGLSPIQPTTHSTSEALIEGAPLQSEGEAAAAPFKVRAASESNDSVGGRASHPKLLQKWIVLGLGATAASVLLLTFVVWWFILRTDARPTALWSSPAPGTIAQSAPNRAVKDSPPERPGTDLAKAKPANPSAADRALGQPGRVLTLSDNPLAFMAFWNQPALTQTWDLAALKPGDESRLGAEFHRLITQLGLIDEESPLLCRVEDAAAPFLGTLLVKEYKCFILKSDAVNAFSTPGGYIYVSRGLFDLIGEEEDYALQFAIGHEIAHVDLLHAIKCLQDPDVQKMTQGTLQKLFWLIIPFGYLASDTVDQEFEADEWVSNRMQRQGRSRREILIFLLKLDGYAKKNGFENGRAKPNLGLGVSPLDNHYRAQTAARKRLKHLKEFIDGAGKTSK